MHSGQHKSDSFPFFRDGRQKHSPTRTSGRAHSRNSKRCGCSHRGNTGFRSVDSPQVSSFPYTRCSHGFCLCRCFHSGCHPAKQPLAQFVVTEIATSASYFITCFIDCRYFKVSINNLGAFTVEYADFASLATAFASSSSVAPSARFFVVISLSYKTASLSVL